MSSVSISYCLVRFWSFYVPTYWQVIGVRYRVGESHGFINNASLFTCVLKRLWFKWDAIFSLSWNPLMQCPSNICITRPKIGRDLSHDDSKHFGIIESVFSKSALRLTFQDIKAVKPYCLFLSNNLEFISIKTTVPWDETACNLVDSYQRFGRSSFFHIQDS
jgi:hypothetical protein